MKATPHAADILHQLTIKARPGKVYQALVRQAGLAGWWTRDCKVRAKVGEIAEFAFHNHSLVFRMKIREMKRNQRVVWQCLGEHPEWRNTKLTFELRPQEGRTVVRFSHRGWKSTRGIYPLCNFDWARYLLSLKSLLETGKGSPHTK